MSTILKALKKLEQETQSVQAAAALTSVEAESKDGSPKKGSKRIWIGLGIGTGLGLGLGLFLLLRPAAPPATTPTGRPVPAAPAVEEKASGNELNLPKVFPPPQPGDEKRTSTNPARAQSATSAGHATGAETATETDIEPMKAAQNARRQKSAVGQTASASTAAQTTRRTSPPPPIAAERAEPRPRSAPQRPTPQVGRGTPSYGGSATAPEAAAATTSQTAPQPASQAAPQAAPQPISPSPPALDTAPVPKAGPSSALKEAATKAPAVPAAPPAAEGSEATPRPQDPFANVSRLEANSPIKLQAISWAQDADQSITVINNTVLHEGDSVEGYTVVKIRPDDVILRRSGRMWRATFSIR